ncbi:transporter substrate-binding domain-containing protein [Bordetella hinzii]|uniref:ABC transporter substrate-binding protein n=2 Tax=Bordetella hinzii TaxID=103855 RepID=A0AAN1RUB8_9BORD|nr:transporter substrate-binding domain-containing protein [Bordetella hinzii]AKQ54501.1 Lysine-arginine-ornithine-binding periplasmic protein precursor [Bordetella hinzii]AKQ59014.1 Lysine-arginine-ornithine-binding periplasmic protein precursor [Bordetella hinzii]AZW15713.1 ABC transporter substrate-binding protein [Bordetella hinzii]KCB26390.1 ABC transporter, substrate-binding protein, family 3 [Bordetella hinzii OH87 BAL007II]KCB31434.1 ABC transporter, substrate-binding protein, family 3
MHFRHTITTLAIAGAAFLGHAPAQAEKLVLGNEGSYPPFSMVDPSGRLTGFEPDLAREMCKRMNVECEFVVMDFKALIPALLQKKLDAVASQTKPLPERKEKVLFGRPVLFNPDSYVVPESKNYTFTPEGLKGVRIGLQRGSAQAKYVGEKYGNAVQIVFYDNPDQIRLDLANGRLDMSLGPKISWTNEFLSKPQGKGWKFAGGDLWTGGGEAGSSWLARKDSSELLNRMNAALDTIIKDCTFTKLRKPYMEVELLPEESACR